MPHAATQSGLTRAKKFLTDHYGIAECNVEVHTHGTKAGVEVHIHLNTVDDLRATHKALDEPEWALSLTEKSASVGVDGVGVTVYFHRLVEDGQEQALRECGLIKGLAVVR